MTSRDIAIAFISSVIGGLVVLFVEQIVSSRREKRKALLQHRVRHPNADRVITDDIFITLRPGNSVALMKDLLGPPIRYRREDSTVFSEETRETHCYIYSVKNGVVKVTSVDNEKIDTLTVFPDRSLTVEGFFFPCESKTYRFAEVQVCSDLVEAGDVALLQTIRESSFAIRYTIPAPHYISFTFFGYTDKARDYRKSNDRSVFIGETIWGVCISEQLEDAFYIYEYELR